jgi:hypothetical protein
MRNRTRDFTPCSIVPQPPTLSRRKAYAVIDFALDYVRAKKCKSPSQSCASCDINNQSPIIVMEGI